MQVLVNIYAVLATVVIVVLVIAMYLRDCSAENFTKCICSSRQGGRQENCQDGDLVDRAYSDGLVTEFTNLVSPGWSKVSPGDVQFPMSQGCNWADSVSDRRWPTWDFTDFGS